MLFDTNKQKGRAGLALAIAYYGSNGYTVSIPLDDTQDYDIVVEKDNIFQKVQVKSTGYKSESGKYSVNLRSFGGTKGGLYGRVIESSADLLFVCTGDMRLYEYKISEMTQSNSIIVTDDFEIFI